MVTFTTVEFASTDVRASASFMAEAFGFASTFYGPAYADIHPGTGVTVAFQGDPAEMPSSPLAIFEVPDLDEARARIVAAGGVVTVEPFAFPGGRRFQFREPGGNELAAWVKEA